MTGIWNVLVLPFGFVYVGRLHYEGCTAVLTSVANVARWKPGGLGKLASIGPAQSDHLHPSPTIRVHELNVLHAIECNPEPWDRWERGQ